ncbi:MAG: YegS/Rv2252/BmrU family lipid kinase, partial [Planctomycetaceae bacterium]|nr:YegS/Rv2252/BmrU family lipid kinase [Planctomycetaceae bacterium]
KFAKAGVSGPYDVIVAAGGDGTLNEVVNGILEADPHPKIATAILPMGTANDFATSAGLVNFSPVSCLKLAAGGPIRPIDVGRLNERYFINVASGGFGAEVTASTPPEMKGVLGGAAYSLMAFVTALNFRPYQARLTLDGELHEETLLMLAVGNGRQCGGGYRVTPKAFVDDGLLDVVIAHDTGVTQWGSVYQEMANPDVDQYQFIGHHRVKSLLIETEEPFQMNLDGEPVRGTHFEFEVLEKRLPFVLPGSSQLLLPVDLPPR